MKRKNRSNGKIRDFQNLVSGGRAGGDTHTFIAQKMGVSALCYEAGTEPTIRFMFMSLRKGRKQ